jgi:hypothetical protein
VLSCVFFIVLSCLLVIFHSTDALDLSENSLTGTIPSQIALLSNLCESSVVWLLVVMIVLCVFFIVLSCLLVIFHSTDYLWLYNNSLTGTIPSQIALLSNLGESSVVWLLVVMILLSCVFFIVLSCLLVIFILQMSCISPTIISRVNSRALLTLFMNVTFPVMTTMIHVDPFRET